MTTHTYTRTQSGQNIGLNNDLRSSIALIMIMDISALNTGTPSLVIDPFSMLARMPFVLSRLFGLGNLKMQFPFKNCRFWLKIN